MVSRLKKIIILLFFLFLFMGCSTSKPLLNIYLQAFDELLWENGAYLDEIDYISIFIEEKRPDDGRLLKIKKALTKKYNKDVYTYTENEVIHAGPYGKEPLSDDGVFLYLKKVTEVDGLIQIYAEKYYTNKKHDAVLLELTY